MDVAAKVAGLAVMMLFSLSACASRTYSAKEIEAWVVDAETKQPIEGANVVAHWALKLERGSRDLVVMETVTDKNGRFHFPAWGPIEIPAGYPAEARLTNQDPAILILKKSYRRKALGNDLRGSMMDHGPMLRESRWHGKTIEMVKFEGNQREYAGMLSNALGSVTLSNCGWTKIPKAMAMLVREADELWKSGIYFGPPTIRSIEGMSEGEPCAGTAKELLGTR